MRKYLHQDEVSGELRLVMADLYDGQHARHEFRVINDDGTPVRRGQQFDGLDAERAPSGHWYVKYGPAFDQRRATFRVENPAVAETRTPCRRLASKSGRAKCALCA